VHIRTEENPFGPLTLRLNELKRQGVESHAEWQTCAIFGNTDTQGKILHYSWAGFIEQYLTRPKVCRQCV